MKIERAKQRDLNEISDIFIVESAKKPYKQKWTKKTALKKIKEFFKRGTIYLVRTKEIIGFIIVDIDPKKEKTFIDELWLRHNYQGRGIGKTLIKFIENEYKKIGVKLIRLISKGKSEAFNFYKRLGYKESKELIFMDKKL